MMATSTIPQRTRTGRDTRPLRPIVRTHVERFLAVSPDGRTMTELRHFLITQRPASRDTIARVLADLVSEGLALSSLEPPWRRIVRAKLATGARRKTMPGRTHVLFTPTRALHDRVAAWFTLSLSPDGPDGHS